MQIKKYLVIFLLVVSELPLIISLLSLVLWDSSLFGFISWVAILYYSVFSACFICVVLYVLEKLFGKLI